MTAIAVPLPSRLPSATDAARPPFIAADVGGTHVRIARIQAGAHPGAPITITGYRKYRCADYANLGDIVGHFLGQLDGPPPHGGVIASAGYAVDDGTVITNNLPWPLSLADVDARTGLEGLRLVNDFEAVAYAAAHVDASEVLQLAGPEASSRPTGPILIVGPGTGLGAAVWIPTRHSPVVLPTEAGQSALAAGTELELEILHRWLRARPHVPNEHALSGPGLLHLYLTLCELRDSAPRQATPSEITAAALAGNDPLARETLDLFCGLLGSTVGDLALAYGVQGGVYLAGGILPQIRDFLINSRFVERFLNKGGMRDALERIPVKLVEHGQLGVIGAANWYLDQELQR